jgi:hypothetical protein
VSNALALTGIVRSDIRSSFGTLTGTVAVLATTLTLTLVNANGSRADSSGCVGYVWHRDRDGEYSL